MTSTHRADKALKGIIKVLQSGAFINRAFIVKRFEQAGYCTRLAERHADKVISDNTDIQHWSRWQIWGTIKGQETYSMKPEMIALCTPMNWA